MTAAEAVPVREPASEAIARTIRGLMAERQISGSKMAALIGIEQRAFSRRHRGEVEWTWNEAQLIAEQLGLDLAELVLRACRDSNPKPSDP